MYRKVQFSIFILILALAGCQTTGVDKAQKTVQSMNKQFAMLKSVPDSINVTISSLNDLLKEGGDMRAEFNAFDKNVNNLVKEGEQFSKLKTSIDSSKSAFVEAWIESQQTTKSDDLLNRSKKRRAAVTEQFDEMSELVAEVGAEFNPWLQEVIDVRTYLESDLNANGVASIANVVPKITKESKSVISKIEDLITELEKLSNAMTATKTIE